MQSEFSIFVIYSIYIDVTDLRLFTKSLFSFQMNLPIDPKLVELCSNLPVCTEIPQIVLDNCIYRTVVHVLKIKAVDAAEIIKQIDPKSFARI